MAEKPTRDQESELNTYKRVFRILALVIAILGQGFAVYSYLQSEVRELAQQEAVKVIQLELDKSQLGGRVTTLELDKAKKEGAEKSVVDTINTLKEVEQRVSDLEDASQSNFRGIRRERERIDQLMGNDRYMRTKPAPKPLQR